MIFTKRLILRPLAASDCETLVREFNNFNISRNTSRIPFPYHMKDAEDYLKFAHSQNAKSKAAAIAWASQPDHLIGAISYLYSENKNDAELGYWLSESQWGHGLMTEAATAMVNHAFTVSNIATLIACYHNDNPVSGHILRKLGFEEGAQCSSFSLAQGKNVAVTNMKLTKASWLISRK